MIEARLHNWARYWRVGFHKRATASLEGLYRPPRGAEIDWETEPAAMAPQPAADAADAILVESAWVRMLNPQYKLLLKLHYCHKRSQWHIKRKLRIREPYLDVLLSAHLSIEHHLGSKLPAPSRILRVNSIRSLRPAA
jgi:hypothetical protein